MALGKRMVIAALSQFARSLTCVCFRSHDQIERIEGSFAAHKRRAALEPYSRKAYAHKSMYRGERNLTVAALELSDGSIAVEAKAEARSTQASSSMGVGHA